MENAKDGKGQEKKFDIKTQFVEGGYIDAVDTVRKWRVGEITEICYTDNTINVHFEGWASKFDDWFPFNSSRIALFRKFTRGYTGQTRVAFRDAFYLDVDELQERSKFLNELMAVGFKGLTHKQVI